jgi:nucleoside-diphosphate-sugar epimerase
MRVFVTGGTGFVGSPAADPVRFAEIDSGAIADIDARHYANAASTHQSA